MTPSRLNEVARQRIQAMVSTTDGFRLAEVDLQIRGPGELAGTRQSGIPEFRVANLLIDTELLSLGAEGSRALGEQIRRTRKIDRGFVGEDTVCDGGINEGLMKVELLKDRGC